MQMEEDEEVTMDTAQPSDSVTKNNENSESTIHTNPEMLALSHQVGTRVRRTVQSRHTALT